MQFNNNTETDHGDVILPPSFNLPLLIITSGFFCLPIPFHPWPTILISSFGGFLLIQSFTLKLKFTKDDLIVLQLGRELRRFPFKNWIAWRILTPKFPSLLYFREEASPHLLPIIFDPKVLQTQLKLKVGEIEINKSDNLSTNENS